MWLNIFIGTVYNTQFNGVSVKLIVNTDNS